MGIELNKCHNLDNLKGMNLLPDSFIDLTVTSPPYDDIKEVLSIKDNQVKRKYLTSSVLRDYKGYSWDIQAIAKELYRVTKEGGIVVWVMNDPVVKGSESLSSAYTRLIFQDAGFFTHDTMIYEKNNFSNPSSNRYHQIFEYMFIFSKGKPKTFNALKDRENKYAGSTNWSVNSTRQKDGAMKERKKKIYTDLGMRFNIWRYTTSYGFAGDKDAYKHPAVFPEKLSEDHILSWSNEGDTVLDIFGGSGTTGKMAAKNKRDYILFDLSKEYCDMAEIRIKKEINKPKPLF